MTVGASRRSKLDALKRQLEERPTAVTPTDDFWSDMYERVRKRNVLPKPLKAAEDILPPIEAKGTARHEARQRNADLVMQHVAGLLPEEYRGVYAESFISPT